MIALQEIREYLFCSLWFYLKHRPSPLVDDDGQEHTLPKYTTVDLPGLAITQALDAYATGTYPEPFPELVSSSWAAWLAEYGIGDDVWQSLQTYADLRNGILAQFTSGKITNRDGRPYTEPRMTTRYKDMLENAGLSGLSVKIDAAALEKMGIAAGKMPGIGAYPLADAYADSLFMAGRYTPPPIQAIYGLQAPAVIHLHNHQSISAKADLVILGESSAVIEVHDFYPAFRWEGSWVGRRLDVVAGLFMTSADPGRPFPNVEKVIYRHFMSGRTIEKKSLRQARLIFALEAVRRGIEADIFIPQFLSGDLSRCQLCPAQGICIPPSGDILEWFLPGEAEASKRTAAEARRLGPLDAQTVQKLLEAIDRDLLPSDLLALLDSQERSRKNGENQ